MERLYCVKYECYPHVLFTCIVNRTYFSHPKYSLSFAETAYFVFVSYKIHHRRIIVGWHALIVWRKVGSI